MRRILTVSLLLHTAAVALVLTLPRVSLPHADEPARIEVLFGNNGNAARAAPAPTPQHAVPPRSAARDPVQPHAVTPPGAAASVAAALVVDPGGAPAPRPPDSADGRAVAVIHPAEPGRPGDPGVRVDEPDPSMIPAKEDPHNRPPLYPDAAAARNEQGTVLVRLHIDAQGSVTWLEQLKSSGSPTLDDAAVAALVHWHFLPAQRDGRPIASSRDQPVWFVRTADKAKK